MENDKQAAPEEATLHPLDGARGGTDFGPRDYVRDRENPDLLVSPRTDKGTMPTLTHSFSDTHTRLQDGGWSREVTAREIPLSTSLAAVNMRLNPGNEKTGVRELHWHKEAEWGFVLSGSVRLTAIDKDGGSFIDDVKTGSLWYFPAGIPHSIQAHSEGSEFLLIFDNGNFTENETFSLTDWFAHTPREILMKNFGLPAEAFKHIPQEERYIFSAPVPDSLQVARAGYPSGASTRSFSFDASSVPALKLAGGQVKIIDSSNFPVNRTVATAFVEVEPGGLREMHWHPNGDEWQYYMEGQARMTVFASSGKARTYDYRAGDVGYVPFAMAHYVENTGNTPLRFIEAFRAERFEDISLNQWLAVTPAKFVQAHLNVDQAFTDHLSATKPIVVAGIP
ncbi:MAG TPA: cupin domain-containing protein [Cytophagales bacterium]